MHQSKLVFAPVMAHLPLSTFRRCVARHDGERKVKSFSCLDQFYAMAFAQLIFRESLRDIEACLATQNKRLDRLDRGQPRGPPEAPPELRGRVSGAAASLRPTDCETYQFVIFT